MEVEGQGWVLRWCVVLCLSVSMCQGEAEGGGREVLVDKEKAETERERESLLGTMRRDFY